MKKLISISAIILVILSSVTTPLTAAKSINVTVDSNVVDFPDAQPFTDENNRVLIPVRFVTEALGAKIYWDSEPKKAVIIKNDTNVTIHINDKNLVVNNRTKTMDTKAINKDDRIYVPIRYVAESFGATVDWNAENNTVKITSGTNTDKSYISDFYRINPDMPQELYTFEYKKGKYDNYYTTNKDFVNHSGLGSVREWVNVAKSYMETSYNVDYRNFDKNKYIENLRWYFLPAISYYTGDGIKRTTGQYIKYLADMIVEKELIIKAEFITDPSLLVSNGNYLTRGRLVLHGREL